jgi:Ankyrin repeats (3 copies)
MKRDANLDAQTDYTSRKRKASDSLGRIAHSFRTNQLKSQKREHDLLPTIKKNDLLPTIKQNDTSSSQSTPTLIGGRGSLVGWTSCPLCGHHSKKRFALGRGIASHLKAVHTPWSPGKVELKNKRRRENELRIVELKKAATAIVSNRKIQNDNDIGGSSHREEKLNDLKTTTPKNLLNKVTDICSNPQPIHLESWEPTQDERDRWDARVLEISSELEQAASEEIARSDANQPLNIIKAGLDRNGSKAVSYRASLPLFLQAAADGDLQSLQCMVATAMMTSSSSDTNNTYEALQQLLQSTDRHLSTAEHWAAGGGHLNCLKYLFEQQEMISKEYTSTEHNIECNNEVVRANDDVTGKDRKPTKTRRIRRRDGKTCLHYAARNGQLECIQYLIHDISNDVNETSGDGTTALHLACYGGHLETIVYLVDKAGANVKACNDWGCTVAHWIAMTLNQCSATVEEICCLLYYTYGVSFVQRQSQGHGPLHKAAQRRNRHIIEWMMSTKNRFGACLSNEQIVEVGLPDDGGHTPSEIWLSSGGDDAFGMRMKQDFGW